ncbi:hypothetical protein [Streptomyces sp. TBY4]|uniref:hypothetical protein n=1 Tax=Streptomyces sp. TBY4 TaxID=2962030 RepID=UPI0020B7295B|nr:hypothetical protein [Streptomyces sp. TBY4]MCP3755785.1 hypothetical protein [Streptomyces sp. TBY4]
MRANLLLMHYARSPLDCPVCEADRLTSMADARAGICIASGVAIEDIDPASGYDHSRRGYDRVRASWIDLIRQHGASEFYEIPDVAKVRARWAEKRPDFVEGDDWLTEAFEAHRQFITALGRLCRRTSCDIHFPAPTL